MLRRLFQPRNQRFDDYISRGSIGLLDELIKRWQSPNWGQEISVVWKQSLTPDLRIDVGGKHYVFKKQMTSLSADYPNGFLSRQFFNNGSAESRTYVGSPIGAFYGYKVAGLYQSYADVLASPVQSSIGPVAPGDFNSNHSMHKTKQGRCYFVKPYHYW